MDGQLEGVVFLPSQLQVASGTLGQTFGGRLPVADFSISFPCLPDDAAEDGFFLEPPYAGSWGSLVGDLHRMWGFLCFQKQGDNPRRLDAMVDTVAISVKARRSVDLSLTHFAATFGTQFDAWYATAMEWIELWTGQVLTKRFSTANRTSGNLWPLDSNRAPLSGWSVGLAVEISTEATVLDGILVRSAFRRASGDMHPPTEWLSYLSAIRPHDSRQAIIEANTAAEVGMAHAIYERLSGLSDGAREKIIMQANGIAGLAELLTVIDGNSGAAPSIGRIKGQLAGPRNRVVHRGAAPTNDEVKQAREVARGLLDAYSPLPGP